MPEKFISYGRQSIDQSDIEAVVKVLKGDWLTQGPAIEIFENDLMNYFGSNHSCVVSNGTAALHLTGLALDWQPDDIVITTPITFLATANCIVYSGAIPDFADIDPVTYTLDPNLVEDKIKAYQSKGKKVKAVIGVDYAGHPCDWKALRQIVDKYDLQLVNDNCHAMGSSYYGDKQYSTKYADVVIQSFHPVKHITTGEGGAILTNNKEIDAKVRVLRTHGITKDAKHMHRNGGPWYYEMHDLGFNYRITDFQCALGSNQLKKLNLFIKKRQAIAKNYDEAFSNIDSLKIPISHKSVDHSYHLYPLQIDFEKLSLSKLDFFLKMKKLGINLQVHYIPIHMQPFFVKTYNFKLTDYPKSEEFYYREVSLPIFPSLDEENTSKVVSAISETLYG